MRIPGCVVVALAASVAGGQEVVFDSFQTDSSGLLWWILTDNTNGINETDSRVENPAGRENAAQMGQAIQLGGAARELDTFSVRLVRAAGNPGWPDLTGILELSIYGTDGFGPTQLLWAGETAFAIPPAPSGPGQLLEVAFRPGVVVPTDIFWSVAARDVVTQPTETWGVMAWGQDVPGPGNYLGPTLALDSTTQEWRLGAGQTIGRLFNQLQVRITAVPGASTCGVAVLALCAYRRRR